MKDKKKIVIGILCGLIMVMAVGYALLSQQLSINGTANITSNWQVEITNIEEISKEGEARTISTDYTATTASFSNVVMHPGDKVTYEITVTNKGTLDAVLESYTINDGDNDAIILQTDKGKSYYKGMKLAKNGGTHKVTVTVMYDPNVSTQPQSTNNTSSIALNYEQDKGQVSGYPEYTVGDKVTFAGSDWYAIEDSDGNSDYVTILKEKVLTNSELGEYAYKTYDTMPYYWDDNCHPDAYGYSDWQYSCDNKNTYDHSKVKEFLENVYLNTLDSSKLKEINGYKVRLITKDELTTKLGYDVNYSSNNLGLTLYATGNVPKWVYKNFGENQNNVYRYWTMTPRESSNVSIWAVYPYGDLADLNLFGTDGGVRPVINVLKSAIAN